MRVALIPGFSLLARSWEPVTALFPSGLDPVPLEVPGGIDFRAAATALGEAGGPAVYTGYSMGGRLALRLALSRPDLVHGLVLVSATPGIADHAARRRRRLEDEALAEWILANGRELFLDRWLEKPIFAGLDPYLARRHRLASPHAIADQLHRLGQGSQEPMWDDLGRLAMPVLLVAGERDPKYVGLAGEMLAEIGLNAHLEVVPGAGHALPVEWPGAVAELIGGFVRDQVAA